MGGGGGGAITPRSQRTVKNGGFTIFIPGAKIYPVMMSIQIHVRGAAIFSFIKKVQYGAF